jgi:hypothetical protein
VDFHVTIVTEYTMSGFFGSTTTSAASDGRVASRVSPLVRTQLSPASSERYT